MNQPFDAGCIVVCGGRSTRMGTPKAALPFGDEVLLARVVRIVAEAVTGPIVVVAARDQELPPLPPGIETAVDERPDRGPLEGLYAGLKRLTGRTEIAFATACDAPLLRPEFVRFVCESVGAHDAAVPEADGYLHPLAAAYRVSAALPRVATLLAAGHLRAAGLFDLLEPRIVAETELRAIDPTLASLRNLNTPDDYQTALRAAGLA